MTIGIWGGYLVCGRCYESVRSDGESEGSSVSLDKALMLFVADPAALPLGAFLPF